VQREAYEKRMSEPVTAGDRIFMSCFMSAVLFILLCGLVAPMWGLWKWRGGWRVAAAVSLAIMVALTIARCIGSRD